MAVKPSVPDNAASTAQTEREAPERKDEEEAKPPSVAKSLKDDSLDSEPVEQRIAKKVCFN